MPYVVVQEGAVLLVACAGVHGVCVQESAAVLPALAGVYGVDVLEERARRCRPREQASMQLAHIRMEGLRRLLFAGLGKAVDATTIHVTTIAT